MSSTDSSKGTAGLLSGASTPPAAPASGKVTGYAIVLLVLLTLVNLLNFLDRQLLFIMADSIKHDLHLSDAQLGLLTGLAFSVVYATMGIPLARLSDRGHSRWVVSGAVALWSLMTGFAGLAQTFVHLAASRLGVALGEAGSLPPSHSLIARHFPLNRRGLALGVFGLGTPFGIMSGLWLGGWMHDAIGWRMAFLLIGGPGVVLALIVAVIVREPQRIERKDAQPSFLAAARALMSNPSYLLLMVAVSVFSIGASSMVAFGPLFLMRTHGMAAGQVGQWLGIASGVAGAIGVLSGGALADFLGRKDRRWLLWTPALCLALAIPVSLTVWFAPSAAVSIAAYGCLTLFTLGYQAPSFAVAQLLAPPWARATSSALLMATLTLVGGSVGPLLVGLISDALKPSQGSDAIRYAMLVVPVTEAMAVVVYLTAARFLRRDLARHAAAEALSDATPATTRG